MEVNYPPPFNYYKYLGSRTTPPCEEDVVWFVVEEIKPIGSTILAMFRDTLNMPNGLSLNTNKNFDGSNRMILPIR